MVIKTCGRNVGFLAAAVSMKRKFVGTMARAMRSIPVARPQDLAKKVLAFDVSFFSPVAFLTTFLLFSLRELGPLQAKAPSLWARGQYLPRSLRLSSSFLLLDRSV